MKDDAHIIARGSDKHKLVYLTADIIYSSHVKQAIVNPISDRSYKFYMHGKLVFLQHGIIFDKSDYKYFLNELTAPADAMIITNDQEKKLVKQIVNYPHILKTGLARYDNFATKSNTKENYITYFPTWNRKIDMTDFVNTEYFKKINEVITNCEINNALKNNKLKLKLILHPEVQKYSTYFSASKNIEILSIDSVVFSKLLSDTKLLITDASSIFFDVLYQMKPVIVYDPYVTHQSITASYATNCVKSTQQLNQLIELVIDMIEHDFEVEDDIRKAINELFEFRDGNNCKRIVDQTFKLFELEKQNKQKSSIFEKLL